MSRFGGDRFGGGGDRMGDSRGGRDSRGFGGSSFERGFGGGGGMGDTRGDDPQYPGLRRPAVRQPTIAELEAQRKAAEAKAAAEAIEAAAKHKADLERRLERPPVPVVSEVIVEGLVLLKIARHAHSHTQDGAQGQLLGMARSDGALVVSDCFASLSRFDNVPVAAGETRMNALTYQKEMLKALKAVKSDNNVVGWYTSATGASFVTNHTLENLFKAQDQQAIAPSVMFVYDPRTGLKALRFTPKFMELYRQQRDNFAGITASEMLEEVPLRVRTNALLTSLLFDLQDAGEISASPTETLDMSASPFEQAGLDFLTNVADEFQTEQSKLQQHVRTVQRQNVAQALWLQKRELENTIRQERGEEPLPLEGPESGSPASKALTGPKRLDSLVLTYQVTATVDQLNEHVTDSLARLQLLRAANS